MHHEEDEKHAELTEDIGHKDRETSGGVSTMHISNTHSTANDRETEKACAAQQFKNIVDWLSKPSNLGVTVGIAVITSSLFVARWASDCGARTEAAYQAQRSDMHGWISGPDALAVGTNEFWVHVSIDGKRPTRYRLIRYAARIQVWGEHVPLSEPDANDEWQSSDPPTSFTILRPIRIELTEDQVANAEQMGTVRVGGEGSDAMCSRQQPINQIYVFATYRFWDGRCNQRTISGFYNPRVCGGNTAAVTPGPTPRRDLISCGQASAEPEHEDDKDCGDKRPKLRIEVVATPAKTK